MAAGVWPAGFWPTGFWPEDYWPAGASAPVAAAGHALAPVAGWMGPAGLAQGPQVGPLARARALAARSAEFGRLSAAGSVIGPSGRGARAGAVELGRLEREGTAGGPVAGSL